jgi:hypothetical protein
LKLLGLPIDELIAVKKEGTDPLETREGENE